jgi:membrane protein
VLAKNQNFQCNRPSSRYEPHASRRAVLKLWQEIEADARRKWPAGCERPLHLRHSATALEASILGKRPGNSAAKDPALSAFTEEAKVADVSNAGTLNGAVVPSSCVGDGVPPVTQSKWFQLRRNCASVARYLLDSEVHTYAFSVAANAIISFIPFVVLLYTLSLSVFHSKDMVGVVNEVVRYYLPSTARQDWLTGSLEHVAALSTRHGVQALSLVLILISCTGIFLPLEVALNQAWGVSKSRNYVMNQLVAFGLALLMMGLAMASIFLSAGQRQLVALVFFHHTDNFAYQAISYFWLTLCTGVASILFFFSIYWILPNRRIPARQVLRTSVITGIIWLVSKYIFVSLLPYLDLKALYGPFYVSVGLLFWAYVSGLILFAGAQFSVTRFNGKKV